MRTIFFLIPPHMILLNSPKVHLILLIFRWLGWQNLVAHVVSQDTLLTKSSI
jgi:hypothetical protein